MLVVRSCCGCIGLRTGCMIIGYVNLVFNLILTILTIMALSAGIFIANTDTDDATKQAGTLIVIISAILLVFLLVFLIFIVLFIVGLHKERSGFVKAYLIYALVFLVFYLIQWIVSLSTGSTGAGVIIQGILELGLSAYFLIVIRSHYLTMVDPGVNTA